MVGVLLVMTVSYAELAERIGRPTAANVAIERAIELGDRCDDPKLAAYVAWLRNRLQASGEKNGESPPAEQGSDHAPTPV